MAEETMEVMGGEAQVEPAEGSGPDQLEVAQEGQASPEETGPQHIAEEDSHQVGDGETQGQVQQLEEQVGQLNARLQGQEREQASLREQLALATSRYRTALLTGAPEVPEELVQGGTVEELDVSLASARRIVERIAQQLETQVASERVPTGAPPRKAPDLSGLSPKEKILYALERK